MKARTEQHADKIDKELDGHEHVYKHFFFLLNFTSSSVVFWYVYSFPRSLFLSSFSFCLSISVYHLFSSEHCVGHTTHKTNNQDAIAKTKMKTEGAHHQNCWNCIDRRATACAQHR